MSQSPNKILLVEDSQFFQSVIRKAIEQDGIYDVLSAISMTHAQRLIDEHKDEIFVALLDVTLPDAPDGEVVGLCRGLGIPSIVFSARYEESLRQRIFSQGVIDYVIKSSPTSLSYVKNLVKRLGRNKALTALVIDDEAEHLSRFAGLLEGYFLTVLTASTAQEAQAIIEKERGLSLIVLDNNMGGDEEAGYKLLQDIRKLHEKDSVAVIGLADAKDSGTVVRFLKFGANDYLTKDCTQEEFISRITQNLDMIDRMRALLEAANQDFMTGLFNRRFLFDAGHKQYEASKRAEQDIAVAVMDIDHFKKVNDTYGHDAGDYVIKKVAGILKQHARKSDIVSRMGGEEFCVVAPNMKTESAQASFDKIRNAIQSSVFEFEGTKIPITISIGVCCVAQVKLERAITVADENLYKAKQAGRNTVIAA